MKNHKKISKREEEKKKKGEEKGKKGKGKKKKKQISRNSCRDGFLSNRQATDEFVSSRSPQ